MAKHGISSRDDKRLRRGAKITERQLYDLKAMPTLYLLDKDKRVILKDAPVEQIEQWLTEKRKSQTE